MPHPVSLNVGQSVTCTISNDDDSAHLTLIKDVTNNSGGTTLASGFTLRLAGGIYNNTTAFNSGATPPVVANTPYTLSEAALAGYTSLGVA